MAKRHLDQVAVTSRHQMFWRRNLQPAGRNVHRQIGQNFVKIDSGQINLPFSLFDPPGLSTVFDDLFNPAHHLIKDHRDAALWRLCGNQAANFRRSALALFRNPIDQTLLEPAGPRQRLTFKTQLQTA